NQPVSQCQADALDLARFLALWHGCAAARDFTGAGGFVDVGRQKSDTLWSAAPTSSWAPNPAGADVRLSERERVPNIPLGISIPRSSPNERWQNLKLREVRHAVHAKGLHQQ